MARTPVTTEDEIADLRDSDPAPGVPVKRTPVVSNVDAIMGGLPDDRPADEITADLDARRAEKATALTLDQMAEEYENGAMDAKPRHEVKPIIDGYRECARPDCTASFKPRSLDPKDTEATEYYCSSDCAISEFYRKRHLGPVPEKIVSGASVASSRAHREEKKRKRIEAAPEHDAKYGPMRKVIEVLGETKTAKKVKLECGHITAARGDQQRCRKCRVKETTHGAPREAASSDKKVRPASRSDKSTPRRSTRTVHEAKEKRTPVKPPKRGKKGKR